MSGAGWFFLLLFLLLIGYAGWVGFKIYNLRRQHEPIPKQWQFYVPFMSTSSSSSNYPSPRSAGPLEWIKDKISQMRNKRTTTSSGYEGTRSAAGVNTGYGNVPNSAGALDPSSARGGRGRGLEDDAWDTRFNSADDPYGDHHEYDGLGHHNDDAELGLAPTPGFVPTPGLVAAYNSGAGDYISRIESSRGVTDTNTAYGGAGADRGRSAQRAADPFGDQHEADSMRGVSPRPYVPAVDTSSSAVRKAQHTKTNSSLGGESDSPASTRKSVFHEGI